MENNVYLMYNKDNSIGEYIYMEEIMARAKNFNLFLMDGDSTGRIKCTLLNWTGLAYKVPRTYLDECKSRDDLKHSGVYFLFGKNDEEEECVYIGQAGLRKNGEGVLGRIIEHMRDEFYFSDAVILTTQNDIFGPTEISYLENKFTNLAIEADRYKIINSNEPNAGNVTEEKESELLEFIDYSKLILGVLGFKVFVPINQAEDLPHNDEMILYLNRRSSRSGKEFQAKCKRTTEGFVVLAGSDFDEKDAPYLKNKVSLVALRDKCKKNGEIVNGKLTKDYLFNSPSYAAAFVLGSSSNGRIDWKIKKG